MICPKCGNDTVEGQVFCDRCGAKLTAFIKNETDDTDSDKIQQPFEAIVSGMDMEEDDDDELHRYLKRDLHANRQNTDQLKKSIAEDMPKEKEGKANNKKHYESDSKEIMSNKTLKDNKPAKKKKNSFLKGLLVVLIAIICVTGSVFATLAIKEHNMTSKFDEYYNKGKKLYDSENYKDAKTQFFGAANNAYTPEQKIKAYEMVYRVDELIGGYDEEEIKYLEMLIDIDNSNIDYYKSLIILYQNNDMNAKIDTLIASAPSALKAELADFDGTIPVASVPEGSYDKPIEVELTATDNVTIYYTLDGSDASESDTRKEYESAIKLKKEGAYQLRAISIDKNGKESKEMSVKYLLSFTVVSAPKVSLSSGTYHEPKKIEVTADSGCKIYYTTDGTVPNKKSNKYKKPIKLPKGDSVYYFIALNEDGVYSSVTTRAYDYKPTYNYSYDSALSTLSSALVSNGTMENSYGEFSNGDVAYLTFNSIEEIDDQFYYIIYYELEDKNGTKKSAKTYAVSTDDGTCYSASGNGDSFTLKKL